VFRGWQGDENEESSAQSFIRFWVSIQVLRIDVSRRGSYFLVISRHNGVVSIEGNLLEFDVYNACVNLCCRAYPL
jgi:hypothetical protein